MPLLVSKRRPWVLPLCVVPTGAHEPSDLSYHPQSGYEGRSFVSPPPSSTVLYARTFLGTHCATHWAVCAGPALALPRHAARAPRALPLPRRGWPRASAAHVASERRPRHVEQTRACAAPSRRVCSQSPFGFPYSAETGPPWGCCASPFQTRQSGCIPIPPAPRGLSCVLPRAPASLLPSSTSPLLPCSAP